MNSKLSKLSPEVRKRAVQMVLDRQAEYPSLRAAMNRLQAEQAVWPRPLQQNMNIILLATTFQGKTAKQWKDELCDGDSSGI